MRKNDIKIKNQMILNIRKSVEGHFSQIDLKRKHFEDITNIKMRFTYKLLDDVKDSLNKDKFSLNDFGTCIKNLEFIMNDLEMLSEMKKMSTQELYNDLQNNRGHIRAMEAYVNFLYRTIRNKNLLELEYKKIQEQITELICEGFNFINDEITSVIELNSFYMKLTLSRYDEVKTKEETVVSNENSYKKIFSYKEMNQLLIDNGFNPTRQTGSHLMFNNGVVTIPIPQHTLGLGLSYAIQRQIFK